MKYGRCDWNRSEEEINPKNSLNVGLFQFFGEGEGGGSDQADRGVGLGGMNGY